MFLAVFEENKIAVFAAQVFWRPHEKDIATAGSHALQLALLGHLADVPEERVDGMRNGGRQRPVRIAFERRPMETSKFHLRQVGRDERSLQFHHGRRMLNDISTGTD